MSALVTPDQAAHWYTREGLPMYTVAKKDGTPRNTTLADARKMDLVPSVTGIIGIIAKPALDAWKQEQAIMSALTLPRLPDEADEDFARRVVKDSKEQVGKAADLGSEVHAFIESYLMATPDERLNTLLPEHVGVKESCLKWVAWAEANLDLSKPNFVERAFASPLGYGGRIDWFGTLANCTEMAVADWKTQFVKTGKEPNFYESWDLQLSAYGHAIDSAPLATHSDVPWIDKRISVVISTNPENPGVWAKTWTGDSLSEFLSALTIWKWLNGYEPAAKKEAVPA